MQNPFYPKKLYFFLLHYSHINCYLRSRMTGRYLMLLCKKPSSVSSHTCPFRRLRRHLSQGKASHTLLQRRSAPRKAVRLLPVSGDGFRFAFYRFMVTIELYILKTMNSFFLSRWLPPNSEGSAELCEAIGACVRTQERIFNTCILCRILTAPRKAVRLLPVCGDGLRFLFLSSFSTIRNDFLCFCG